MSAGERFSMTASGAGAHRPVTSFLVNIGSTQDRQLLPEPLIKRCYFT